MLLRPGIRPELSQESQRRLETGNRSPPPVSSGVERDKRELSGVSGCYGGLAGCGPRFNV